MGVGAVVASGGGSTVGSVCVRLRPAGGARWWSLGLTAGFEVAGVVAGFAWTALFAGTGLGAGFFVVLTTIRGAGSA